MGIVNFSVTVTGRVQGVSFRYYACEQAIKFGLTGWVKNNPDGSISLEIEGQKENVENMLDWLHHGPPYASVTQVLISPGKVKKYSVFEITS